MLVIKIDLDSMILRIIEEVINVDVNCIIKIYIEKEKEREKNI